MTALREALADYLAMRRAMGYRLARAEKLLGQFLTFLEERGETRLRTRTALAWATLPPGDPSWWWKSRLAVVRGFATYLHTVDPTTEIPSTDQLRAPLPAPRRTPTPTRDIAHLLADPKYTYWYLSATPALMQLAADRLERHQGGSA